MTERPRAAVQIVLPTSPGLGPLYGGMTTLSQVPLVPTVPPRVNELEHATRRMLQALDAYWLHCDGLPKGRYPRGRYNEEDWWIRFEKYRGQVNALLPSPSTSSVTP